MIAKLADRDHFGNIVLVLNSPGGSVKAAFELVKVMDDLEVTTLVPDNARCASACASILYVSGRYHNILGTGLLGLHTCYNGNSKVPEPDSTCNNLVAQNAFAHGTDYASVDFGQKAFGPSEMGWIDRNLACSIGLCGPPMIEQVEAVPSFSCERARSAAEKAICADRRLARYDREIAIEYKKIVASGGEQAEEQIALQRQFLIRRDDCDAESHDGCLLAEMRRRLVELATNCRWEFRSALRPANWRKRGS